MREETPRECFGGSGAVAMTADEALRPCETGEGGEEEEVWLVQLPPGTRASDLEGAKFEFHRDRLEDGKEDVGTMQAQRIQWNVAQESRKLVQATYALIPDDKGTTYKSKKVARRITLLQNEDTSTPVKTKKRRRDSHAKKDKRQPKEDSKSETADH